MCYWLAIRHCKNPACNNVVGGNQPTVHQRVTHPDTGARCPAHCGLDDEDRTHPNRQRRWAIRPSDGRPCFRFRSTQACSPQCDELAHSVPKIQRSALSLPGTGVLTFQTQSHPQQASNPANPHSGGYGTAPTYGQQQSQFPNLPPPPPAAPAAGQTELFPHLFPHRRTAAYSEQQSFEDIDRVRPLPYEQTMTLRPATIPDQPTSSGAAGVQTVAARAPAPYALLPGASSAPRPPPSRQPNPAWSGAMLNPSTSAPVPPPTRQSNPAWSERMLSTAVPPAVPVEPRTSSSAGDAGAAHAAAMVNRMDLNRTTNPWNAPDARDSRRFRDSSNAAAPVQPRVASPAGVAARRNVESLGRTADTRNTPGTAGSRRPRDSSNAPRSSRPSSTDAGPSSSSKASRKHRKR